jgi:transposase
MARRSFDVIDISEILIHWHAGRSQNQIAASLGVDRRTVRKYTAAAIAAGMRPGGPAVSEERWAELARGWFPELADTRLRQVTWPAIAAHHEFITGQLEAGVTMATVHQRLRDERGLAVSVASFRRYVAANLPEEARRSQVRVLRPDPAEPGAEAQIDYGQLGRWVDPATGKKHVIWAFAIVLACSRHMFVRPVIRLDQHAWTECHVTAFAFFGGVPARLVPDNLKTGVDKPDLYDPKINRSYAEMAAHYGVLVDPARSRKPRDKARIERPMPYIRDSFWRGREWSSLAQMQAGAQRWCAEVAGQRSCRPLDGAAPAVVFAAVEEPALRPLPRAPFAVATWAKAKIGPDLHARVDKVLYSLPWQHRQDRRCAGDSDDGAVLHRRRAGQDPPAQELGQTDRFRRLPISYVESRTGRRESPLRSGRVTGRRRSGRRRVRGEVARALPA